MRTAIKNHLRKHPGPAWLLCVCLAFLLVDILCTGIMTLTGVSPSVVQSVAVEISSVAALGMFLVLAVWGLRHL